MTYIGDAAEGPEEAAERERRGRHDVEFPAAADVLVRAHAVRHRVRARVHQEVHAGLRQNNLVGSNPKARELYREASGNAFMELQFYGPGYVPQFEGSAAPRSVLRGDDHRQPHANQNTGVDQTPPPATTSSSAAASRSTGPTSPGTGSPRRRRTRCSPAPHQPELQRGEPEPGQGPVHEPGRSDPDPHARHARRVPDRPDRPHHRPARLDDGLGGQRVRPHPVHPELHHLPGSALRVPPRYSTANPRGNTWSAHTYNVAMSDEIGHFENCLAIDANGNCTSPGPRTQVWTRTTPSASRVPTRPW